jgi:hypothetical protein
MPEYSAVHVTVAKLCCRVIPVFREMPNGFPPLRSSDAGLLQVYNNNNKYIMYVYVHTFLISYIAKSLHPVGSAVILRPHALLVQMGQYSLNHF